MTHGRGRYVTMRCLSTAAVFRFMALSSKAYLLPEGGDAAGFIAGLVAQVSVQVASPQTLLRTYLDTVDWRLYAAGGPLLVKQLAGDRYSLIWEDAGTYKPLGSVRARRFPTHPADLPVGYLRDKLSQVVGARALLPLVRLRSRLQLVGVFDDDGHTIVRLRLESAACGVPGTDPSPIRLVPRVTLVPARGQGLGAARMERLLIDELGLQPARRSQFEQALAAVGRRPGD